MKKVLVPFFILMTFPLLFANVPVPQSEQEAWQEIRVVYDSDEVANLTKGDKMTKTINTSLNFGKKPKFERRCLEALKKQAAAKGYNVLLIDEEASRSKRFNKRGIEVTVVATGYSG